MCEVNWTLLLEYLKVLLGWPPVVFLLVAGVVVLFREEISLKFKSLQAAKVAGQEMFFAVQSQSAVRPVEVPLPGSQASTTGSAGISVNKSISDEVKSRAPVGTDFSHVVEWVQLNPGPTVEEFVRLAESLQFEKVYVLIFGTQVDALLVAAKWSAPQSVSLLRPNYDLHCARVMSQTPITQEEYFKFLFAHQLIERPDPSQADLVMLTERGRRFVTYIVSQYPHGWSNRPW